MNIVEDIEGGLRVKDKEMEVLRCDMEKMETELRLRGK